MRYRPEIPILQRTQEGHPRLWWIQSERWAISVLGYSLVEMAQNKYPPFEPMQFYSPTRRGRATAVHFGMPENETVDAYLGLIASPQR